MGSFACDGTREDHGGNMWSGVSRRRSRGEVERFPRQMGPSDRVITRVQVTNLMGTTTVVFVTLRWYR